MPIKPATFSHHFLRSLEHRFRDTECSHKGVGISVVQENTADCLGGWKKSYIINQTDLNHGIELSSSLPSTGDSQTTYLYASSSDSVFRWAYNSGTFTVDPNSREELVNGMSNADHSTRTLLLSDDGQFLYVSRGSQENVDAGAADVFTGRSQIRRFSLEINNVSSAVLVGNGTVVDWMEGELVAWGLRNGVGMSFDDRGNLWEVENSADQVSTEQFGDIHRDNPAEELNLIPLPPPSNGSLPESFGYPSCFTYWNLSSSVSSPPSSPPPIGSSFSINASLTDEDCNQQFTSPTLSFQAHSAPLDIKFLGRPRGGEEGSGCSSIVGANVEGSLGLLCDWRRNAFVSFHGSWNREDPTGYEVVRIPWGDGAPIASSDSGTGYSPVISSPRLSRCPNGCFRPVGLVFDKRGRLFVTSDSTGEVFVIQASNSTTGGQTSDASSLLLPTITTLISAMMACLALIL
ncbi:hypothetical protein BT69DRAFT_1351483 [Atractiella rhizophila]|nr:hypothetical protein BT69DRAFT_1351483 [Atractiella rhizophila]